MRFHVVTFNSILALAAMVGCSKSDKNSGGTADTDTDIDTDSDIDVDTDTDADTDTATESDTDTCTGGTWEGGFYYMIDEPADLTALTGYTELATSLEIGCATCVDLEGLECVTHIDGYVRVYGNPALTSLTGLDRLSSMEQSLLFKDNPLLTDLTGLSALTSLGGELRIRHQNALTNLDGLAALTSVGWGINISWNPALPDCEVCELLDQLPTESLLITVYNNIDDTCTPVPDNCP